MIEQNPKILSGIPVIKGTRIPVSQILACLADGMSVDEVIRNYPRLTREDINGALLFASKEMDNLTNAYPITEEDIAGENPHMDYHIEDYLACNTTEEVWAVIKDYHLQGCQRLLLGIARRLFEERRINEIELTSYPMGEEG